jgi:hypothetical protein
MIALRAGWVGFLLLIAPPALANCQPSPPGLAIQDWFNLCTSEINFGFQTPLGNPYGIADFKTYVNWLYTVYQNPPQQGAAQLGASGGLVGNQCAPDGATMCNSSGWLQTCSGGIWTTGATQC